MRADNSYMAGRQSNTQFMTVEEADAVVRRQKGMFTRLEGNKRRLAIYEGVEGFPDTWNARRQIAVENGMVISSSVYIASSGKPAI